VLLEALALALALAELVLLLELELELELEHPAIATRPAATTVTLSQVDLRRLNMFTSELYAIRVTHCAAEFNEQVNGSWREDGQTLQICSALRSAYGRVQRVARGQASADDRRTEPSGRAVCPPGPPGGSRVRRARPQQPSRSSSHLGRACHLSVNGKGTVSLRGRALGRSGHG
jgi:hypothetical protein